MNIYFDIETLPNQDASYREKVANEIKPPATMKKAETIAEWVANEKENAINEAVLKTSFDGGRGSICCIGWAIDDGDVQSITGDESYILQAFFGAINAARKEVFRYSTVKVEPVFVGHNVSAFDLRFLFQRAIVNKIKPPTCIPFNAKSWDSSIFDTMTYWAGYGNRVSLATLCDIFGIESDNTHTGADVYPMYLDGKIEEIASYCHDDVRITREVYKRLTFN